jgi:hypothetical protein
MSVVFLGTLLVGMSALEALTFVVGYHLASRGIWRRDPMGRHVMAFVAVDAGVFGLAVIRAIGGASLDTGWFALLRLVVFLGVPWVLGWRLWILWRLYRQHKPPVNAVETEDAP